MSMFGGTNLNSEFLTRFLLVDNKLSIVFFVSILLQLLVLYSMKTFIW